MGLMGKLNLEADGIECSVRDPEKHGDTMNNYITFKVATKTVQSTWPQFKETEFSVRRRFKDFVWLRTSLCENHANVIVPPLPDKEIFNIDKFSQDFLEKRRVGLQNFLNRCLDHPTLRKA